MHAGAAERGAGRSGARGGAERGAERCGAVRGGRGGGWWEPPGRCSPRIPPPAPPGLMGLVVTVRGVAPSSSSSSSFSSPHPSPALCPPPPPPICGAARGRLRSARRHDPNSDPPLPPILNAALPTHGRSARGATPAMSPGGADPPGPVSLSALVPPLVFSGSRPRTMRGWAPRLPPPDPPRAPIGFPRGHPAPSPPRCWAVAVPTLTPPPSGPAAP